MCSKRWKDSSVTLSIFFLEEITIDDEKSGGF